MSTVMISTKPAVTQLAKGKVSALLLQIKVKFAKGRLRFETYSPVESTQKTIQMNVDGISSVYY